MRISACRDGLSLAGCGMPWYIYLIVNDSFEIFLDDISRCFLERDFTLWRSRVTLPLSIITRRGPVILSNEAVLYQNFECYLKSMDAMQLDFVDRKPIEFERCDDGTILGTFQTRLLSHGILLTDSYIETALLQKIEGRFRLSSLLNGRSHYEWVRTEFS